MATPLGVVSFDLDGLVTSWNPAAEKIFGFRESDVLGKTNPIVPPEYLADHRRLLKSTLVGSVTSSTETIRQRLDGSRIPVSISNAPLLGSDGKQIGVMAAIPDINERMRLQLELKEKTTILLTVTQALRTRGSRYRLRYRQV